jgi:hypothetical protein
MNKERLERQEQDRIERQIRKGKTANGMKGMIDKIDKERLKSQEQDRAKRQDG